MDTRPNISPVRVGLVMGLVIAATACDRDASTSPDRAISPAEMQNAVRLLKSGDPRACGAEGIADYFFDTAMEQPTFEAADDAEAQLYREAVERRMTMVTATAIDREVPRMTCEAVLSGHYRDDGYEVPIAYELLLQVEPEDVLIRVSDVRSLASLNAGMSSIFFNSVIGPSRAIKYERRFTPSCESYLAIPEAWGAADRSELSESLGWARRYTRDGLSDYLNQCRDALWQHQQRDTSETNEALLAASRERELREEEARAAAQRQAEADRFRREDRREYTGPPVVVPGPSSEPPPSVRPNVILNPSWETRPPTPEYPPAALAAGITGAVTTECVAAPDRTVRSCSVVSETPSGQGFGQAALASVRQGVLSRRSANDIRANGRFRVQFSFQFE